MAVKARVLEVMQLSSAELIVEYREWVREMAERRRLEGDVEQLRVEIGAL